MTVAKAAGGGEAREPSQAGIEATVRTAITNGSLPRLRSVLQVEAAPGDGQACDICRTPILREQYQYEIEAVSTVVRLHSGCFRVWYEESHRQDGDTRG